MDLPEVQGFVINDGQRQRSIVTSLRIEFNGLVDIQDLNGNDPATRPFQVRKRGNGGGLVDYSALAPFNNICNRTEVTLTFFGAFTELGHSLLDGNYDLVVNATKVSRGAVKLDGDRNGVAGGDALFGRNVLGNAVATDDFFRFFGDADGDRDVDTLDSAKFNATYVKPTNALSYIFDNDADGDVDTLDKAKFNARKSIGKLKVV